MKFKKLLAMALIGTMALSLAACGSTSNTEDTNVSTEQGEADTKSEFDTMVVGLNELNGIFNPFFYKTAFDSYVFGPVFSSVCVLDDDNNLKDDAGSITTKEIKDDAGNVKQVEYTIKLQEGLTFSDGKPVTIDDYLFGIYVGLLSQMENQLQ